MVLHLMNEGSERGWRCRKLPRWIVPACIFILSVFLHASTLRGGFVWDDQPAVLENRDIWTDSPWEDVWRHDFWGQQITDAESHKSYRPLTTLTYRLSNIVARRATSAAAASNKADGFPVMDRVAPTDADAPGFHLVNVFVHALTCGWSVFLFRGVFSGEELPSVVSSLLFTVHPVHVEAVAPIVGRADLLCGLFAVIALSLTVGGGNTYRRRGKDHPFSIEQVVSCRRGNQGLEHERRAKSSEIRAKTLSAGASTATSSVGPSAQPTEPRLRTVDSRESETSPVVSDALTRAIKPPSKVDNSTTTDHLPDPSHPPDLAVTRESKQLRLRSKSLHGLRRFDRAVNDKKRSPCRNATVLADSGIGSVTFITTLAFASVATLCKEVGVTVFGIIAFAEVVRFLDENGWGLFIVTPSTTRTGNGGNALGPASSTSVKTVLQSHHFRSRLLPSVARFSSALLYAGALIALHVDLHGGAAVRVWGVLENDIAILPSFKERALSYAYTHAVYASKLLWPDRLCYDWGFRCIPHVTSTTDPALLAPFTVYTTIIVAAAIAISRRDTVVIWGLAFIVVPFMPSSNVLLSVGAVVAERLLYLPSLGACVLAGRMLSRENARGDNGYDGSRDRIIDSARSGGEGEPVPERKNFLDAASLDTHQWRPTLSNSSRIYPWSILEFHIKKDLTGDALKDPPVVKVPRTTSAALTQSSGGVVTQTGECIRRRVASGSLRVPIALVLLLSWAAFFGARTVRRCEDWKSERLLFESALQVCPDGIKTLNNLAASMLSVDEANRAEELLTRAIELHPYFPRAHFNLGVARMLRENHVGAVAALERSLALEPHSTRTMVYLGLEYLTLTKEAVETTAAADFGNRAHYSSTLLSRAETVIDQALAAGSGLPLARLVKGDALILRGQPQLAAGFLRDGIELTHRLLDGGSSSVRGGGNGGRTERDLRLSDALNLPVAYNQLGLALRNAGSGPIATKEAFLEGLSMAPEDFALLVNCGAEHQAAGDIAGARALYHRALLQDPTSPELLSNLGWLEEESGGGSLASLEKAADLYGRALAGIDVGSPARSQVEVNFANVQNRLRRLCEGGEKKNCS